MNAIDKNEGTTRARSATRKNMILPDFFRFQATGVPKPHYPSGRVGLPPRRYHTAILMNRVVS